MKKRKALSLLFLLTLSLTLSSFCFKIKKVKALEDWFLVFSDNFNRADLGSDWIKESGGPYGVDPDIVNNKLKCRITQTGAGSYSRAIKNSSDDYGPTQIKFQVDIVNKTWAETVRVCFGLKHPDDCWKTESSSNPNTGFRFIYLDTTSLQFQILIEGTSYNIGTETVDSGNNTLVLIYNFNNGDYTVTVDDVDEWSGTQDPVLSDTTFKPFFSCYTYGVQAYYDNVAIYKFSPTIEFKHNEGGIFRANNMTKTNGTQTAYENGTILELVAIPKNSSYVFQSFNWTGGSSTSNPHNYTVVSNMTIWLYFGIAEGAPTPYIIARFTFNISNPEPNDPILFNGSFSESSDTISAYNWTFGDGNITSGAEVTHSYVSAGTFSVNLTVTSSAGTDSFIQSVTVEIDVSPYIFARFTFSPSNPAINETIQFDGTESESSSTITDYFWTFDDGSNSTSATPSHSYSANGTYTISLKVTSAAGNNVFSQDVTVGGVQGTTGGYSYLMLILLALPIALLLALILNKRTEKNKKTRHNI